MRDDTELYKNYEKCTTLLYMSLVQSFEYDVKNLLLKQGMRDVAIYGMGEEGVALFWFLKKYDITIKYVTDRFYENIYIQGVRVIEPESISEEIDVLIISSSYYFDEIKNSIGYCFRPPIVSAKEMLENILQCSKNENQ